MEASSSISNLYLVETVETELKEHISINDEERQRQGYELQTCYCFDQRQPVKSKLMLGDAVLAMLTYAPSARIWRINKGWSRRSDRNTLGFVINPSNGKWSKEETLEAEAAGAEENNNATKKDKIPTQRIIPYVNRRVQNDLAFVGHFVEVGEHFRSGKFGFALRLSICVSCYALHSIAVAVYVYGTVVVD